MKLGARQTRKAVAMTVASIMNLACTHDFSVFDPIPGEAGDNPEAGEVDSGIVDATDARSDSEVDATTGGKDAVSPSPDATVEPSEAASPPDDGSSCGADCLTGATGCAGTCAEEEESCAAYCDSGSGCSCSTQETACVSQCVSQCETCTSVEGCVSVGLKSCPTAAP